MVAIIPGNKHDNGEVHEWKLIWNMNLFFWGMPWACQRSRGNLGEKNNIKGTLFSSVLEYTKRCPRVGRRLWLFFGPSGRWGHMQGGPFDGVLFDHLMLEGMKAHISNYSDLTTLLDFRFEVGSASWYGRGIDSYGDTWVRLTAARSGNWKSRRIGSELYVIVLRIIISYQGHSRSFESCMLEISVYKAELLLLQKFRLDSQPWKLCLWKW